jgi:hypothetical protein
MVTASSLPRRLSTVSAALAAASLTVCAQVAMAASPSSWLGRALTLHFGEWRGRGAAPAHYVIDTGGGFVLDRGDHGAFLKFDDSPEIWVLTRARGPRGDMIFTDDLGEPVLRTTRLGGVTVFTRRHPEGSAAALAGASAPLRPSPVSPGQLMQRMVVATLRASRAAGRPISFVAGGADLASRAVIADAALVASEAMVAFSATPGGRGMLSRVSRVDIAPGRRVAAALAGGDVKITVVPADGLYGRPSSAMVMRALAPGPGPGVEAVYFPASRP